MVSAFGATDNPTSEGKDPADIADKVHCPSQHQPLLSCLLAGPRASGGPVLMPCPHQLASFVIDNNLDGVDIDYEDNAAMNAGKVPPVPPLPLTF